MEDFATDILNVAQNYERRKTNTERMRTDIAKAMEKIILETCELSEEHIPERSKGDVKEAMLEILKSFRIFEDEETVTIKRNITVAKQSSSSITLQNSGNLGNGSFRVDILKAVQEIISEYTPEDSDIERLRINKRGAVQNITSTIAQSSEELETESLRHDVMETMQEIIAIADQISKRTESFKRDMMRAMQEIVSMTPTNALEVELDRSGNPKEKMPESAQVNIRNSKNVKSEKFNRNVAESTQGEILEDSQKVQIGRIRIEIEETI